MNAFNGAKSSAIKKGKALSIYIPASPLTPPRKVVNGLGNIVKTIDFGLDGIGPASRELETAISEYLKNHPGKPTVDVWALAIPPDPAQRFAGNLKDKWSASEDPYQANVGDWICKGAKLCRVRRFSNNPHVPYVSL